MTFRRALFTCFCLAFTALVPNRIIGQSTLSSIGRPSGAAVFPIEHGYIDLSNGNVHLDIPIEGYKQRGDVSVPATFTYDSSIWAANYDPATGIGSWSPTNVPDNISAYDEYLNIGYTGWRFNYLPNSSYLYLAGTSFPCTEPSGSTVYIFPNTGFIWYDPRGTAHTFAIQTVDIHDYGCTNSVPYADTPTGSAYATDGSGYYATITDYDVPTIWDPDGTMVAGGGYTSSQNVQVDRNGNCLNCVTTGDTLGRNPISITSGGTNSNGQYVEYMDVATTGGATARYTITYESITFNTNFGVSGVSEFSGSAYAVASIGLPDGTSYSFSYENGTYGDLVGIKLPHGATVSLSYTNDVNGATEPLMFPPRPVYSHDGSNGYTTFSFTDQNFPGSDYWLSNAYCHYGSGSEAALETSDTVINSPSKAVYFFETCGDGLYNYETDFYSSDTSSTIVSKTLKSFDFTHLNPIDNTYEWANVTGTTQVLLDSALTSDVQFTYATPGNGIPTTVKQWDYYSAAPTSLPDSPSGLPTREIDQTLGYDVNGALFPTLTTYKDSTGNAISEIQYCYDQNCHGASLVPAPSSTPNLVGVSGNRGNLTTLTSIDPVSSSTHVSTFTYDTAGAVQSVQDPNGNTTTFSYDPTDTFVTKTTVPSTNGISHITQRSYDPNTGQTLTYTDQNNQTTTYNYDSIGRLQSVSFSNAGSPITLATIQHPSADETDLTVQQSPTQTISISAFTDAYGRKSQTIQSGISQEWTYDSHGRLYTVTNPHLTGGTSPTDGTTTYTYDELGRVTNVQNPTGQSLGTHYVGNTRTLTDPLGHQRIFTYDAFGDLTSVTEPDNSNTLDWTTTYGYNGFGKLATVNQEGQTRTFNYNGFGYLTSETTPESGTTSFGYDNNGNLKSVTDQRSLSTTYNYDALNRVINKIVQNGPTYIYTYDAQDSSGDQYGVGMLTGFSNGSNVQSVFTHNPFGYLISETFCLPSDCTGQYEASATPDYLGNVTSLTYPDGRTLATTYNTLNQLTSETYTAWNGTTTGSSLLSNVSYYPPGEVASATYGNGMSLTATYDANQNLKTLGYLTGSAATCNAYQWQANAANLQNITYEGPGVTRTFSYDQLDRVSSVSDSGGSNPLNESYSYDSFGNLQQSGNFTFNAPIGSNNQVEPGNGYQYDAAGNLTQDGLGNRFSIGADGLLTGSNNATYTYDSLGQRVRKDNGGADSQEYFYFGGILLAMRDASNGTWSDHIYGAGRYIASIPGTQTATPIYRAGDHLDSLMNQTDANGNVLSSTNVTPFGQLASDNSGDNFVFTDHERDSENSTDHTLFRQYSFVQGRWISPDPSNSSYVLTDPQSLNRYAYLTNRPTNKVDRLGLDDDDDDSGGGWYGDDDDDDSGGNTFTGFPDEGAYQAECSSDPSTCIGSGGGGFLFSSDGTMTLSAFGGNADIATGDSSSDAAPTDGGSEDVSSGDASNSVASDILMGGLMLLGNVPEIGTIANGALAAVYLAKGQYGQAALFGGAALYSAFGGIGGSEIADGVEALNAAREVSETALEAASESVAEESTLVCRGGLCTADRFANGSGVTIDANGNLQGVSVNSAPGVTLQELTSSFPNPRIGVADLEDIEAAGGTVTPSPTPTNPYHCTLCGISPQQAEELFTPTVPNPNR